MTNDSRNLTKSLATKIFQLQVYLPQPKQPLFDLQVTATPENIPESIEVDITDLQINDSYSVGDIKVSGDFTIENDPEESVVTVVPPTDEPSEEEIEAMEGESATEEPEVAGEDKEDKEDEENKDEE